MKDLKYFRPSILQNLVPIECRVVYIRWDDADMETRDGRCTIIYVHMLYGKLTSRIFKKSRERVLIY